MNQGTLSVYSSKTEVMKQSELEMAIWMPEIFF